MSCIFVDANESTKPNDADAIQVDVVPILYFIKSGNNFVFYSVL